MKKLLASSPENLMRNRDGDKTGTKRLSIQEYRFRMHQAGGIPLVGHLRGRKGSRVSVVGGKSRKREPIDSEDIPQGLKSVREN
jgi:hypothetical protein